MQRTPDVARSDKLRDLIDYVNSPHVETRHARLTRRRTDTPAMEISTGDLELIKSDRATIVIDSRMTPVKLSHCGGARPRRPPPPTTHDFYRGMIFQFALFGETSHVHINGRREVLTNPAHKEVPLVGSHNGPV